MDVTFTNKQGNKLAGVIDPANTPIAYAVYLHCFTCSKNHAASYRLCKALAAQGIQVLRYDFSGLGKSEGDFSSSYFSDNIDDISSAIEYLNTKDTAPQLLIGHSFGGIAAVAAACKLDQIQAVATIASPSRPAHVLEHFKQHIPKILENGSGNIEIFDRSFRFTREYIEDLRSYDEQNFIRELNKPLLVLHAPLDNIVSIDEAARIFTLAKHPKSFISLDNTDHLISKKHDAEYIAANIACWAKRYINTV